MYLCTCFCSSDSLIFNRISSHLDSSRFVCRLVVAREARYFREVVLMPISTLKARTKFSSSEPGKIFCDSFWHALSIKWTGLSPFTTSPLTASRNIEVHSILMLTEAMFPVQYDMTECD